MNQDLPLVEQRRLIRPLLAPTSPEDALTAYYALIHDSRRTQLATHLTPGGHADGFVAVCQTGQDLFVPLVVLRAAGNVIGELLQRALYPGRPYRVITLVALREAVQGTLTLDRQQINHIYTLEPASFHPQINVMVQPGEGPFRFEVRSGEQVVAAAGVNWQSDRLAELYVYVEPEFYGRGWGRTAAAACVQALLEARLLPLYAVAEDNVASQRLALSLGFADSGAREWESLGRLCG